MATREEKLQLIENLKVQIEIVAESLDEVDDDRGSDGLPLSTLYLSDVLKKKKPSKNMDQPEQQVPAAGAEAGGIKDARDPLDDLIEKLNEELCMLKSKLGAGTKKK